jgi:aminoglycoside 3-N-acetyltransferase
MSIAENLTARVRKFVPQPVRNTLKHMRSVVRGVRRSSTAEITALDLAGNLRDAGIAMPAYGSADAAIRASNEGRPLDLRSEPSGTGKITEAFRRTPGVHRSSHPFSSVCAWGRHAAYLTSGHDLDERICHPDSPLARLLQLNGKIVGLGVSLGPVSFYHVIEDTWSDFPFNTYAAPVEVTYLDASGRTTTRTVSYYDRQMVARRIDGDGGLAVRQRMTERLASRGLLHRFRCGNAESWWFSTSQVYEELKELARQGVTIYESTPTPHV